MNFLILGCGYTGKMVAEQLRAQGHSVLCTNRSLYQIHGAQCIELDISEEASRLALVGKMTEGMRVLHSIPPTADAEYTATLMNAIQQKFLTRVVYLSTTGVYGAAETVDSTTPVAPDTPRDERRVAAEQAVLMGAWSAMVLRPAAIYGPGRGVHTSVKKGEFHMPDGGERVVSRIHVEDLARVAVAALLGEVTGAYPIADKEPAPSVDVVKFAASVLEMPMPSVGESRGVVRSRGRKVDGREALSALGLTLLYPTYQEGTIACLRAERHLS